MQKKIIALAVAAVASGAAFAQSNVVISGNLNYQLENASASNPSGTTATAQTTPQLTNREGRARLNENGSNIKFAVTEDLGNGLKAMAVVESGIQPTDTNAANGNIGTGIGGGTGSRGGLGGRDSYLALAGNFGTIVAGRLSVHYNSQAGIDSFGGNTALAANSLAILHGVGGATPNLAAAGTMAGYGAAAGGRLGNTVAYVTPSFNGFNATFGYARPNVTAGTDGVVNTVTGQTTYRKESGWTVKVNFDNGPISAFLSYLAHNDVSLRNAGMTFSSQLNDHNHVTSSALSGTAAGAAASAVGAVVPAQLNNWTAEVRGFRMGAAYTFPMGLKLGLIYDTTKNVARNDLTGAPAADTDYTSKRTAWVIPMSWAFGPHTVGATYGKANNVSLGGSVGTTLNAALVDMNATGARYWMAGYQYAFSKRTNIGLTFARIDNDDRAAYDFFSNAGIGMSANLRGSDPTSVSLGLKHSF